jgi:uncharacterized protein YdbL (DUF1318 family)
MEDFIITSIHRDDIQQQIDESEEGNFCGITDASKITDAQMKRIASKMADAYVGGGQFWQDIDLIVPDVIEKGI